MFHLTRFGFKISTVLLKKENKRSMFLCPPEKYVTGLSPYDCQLEPQALCPTHCAAFAQAFMPCDKYITSIAVVYSSNGLSVLKGRS